MRWQGIIKRPEEETICNEADSHDRASLDKPER